MSEKSNKSSDMSFQTFLMANLVKKGNPDKLSITNTRIGDKKSGSGIIGGSYSISEKDYPTFLKLYKRDILDKQKSEYLTEKQLENNGPLLVDIDLRYNISIKDRQHTVEHINDLLDTYLCCLGDIYNFKSDVEWKIFVMEKQKVNPVEEKEITKDGIHLIFGLNVDRTTQKIIRNKVMLEIKEAWSDLPIINTWDDVLDAGITEGHTNWQLYGSKKPKHDTYKITCVYKITYDSCDGELSKEIISDYEPDIYELSIRNKNNPSFDMKSSFMSEYNNMNELSSNNIPIKRVVSNVIPTLQDNSFNSNLNLIKCQADIDILYETFLDNLKSDDYNLREAANYTMALSSKFYGQGSYSKWIRVCWALKNSDKDKDGIPLNKLLIVWIKFSSQSESFKCSSTELDELVNTWNDAVSYEEGGITKRSLAHWVREENPEAYKKISEDNISFYVDRTIYGEEGINGMMSEKYEGGDVDLAAVLYQMMKNDYVCTSIGKKHWYKFSHHRWRKNDSGTSLRKAISHDMRSLYASKSLEITKQLSHHCETQNLADPIQQKKTEKYKLIVRKISKILELLKQCTKKNLLMIEAMENFYDNDFIEKLDMNPYLLCFNNGVFDFKEKKFRPGRPDDYISFCTNIDYVELTPKTIPIQNEIHAFFDTLFPRVNEQNGKKELKEYMWQHLASTLMGTTDCQTFNMYVGKGQNGKSVLISLMELILGEYKGDVPLSTITGKERTKVGGVSPEMVELKGKRYALMQEPSKHDVINEGIMKQITSGEDNLQGRVPFAEKTISFKPQLKLVVTTNVYMTINSDDFGTWRRIRVVPFESHFKENPVTDDPDSPYQFKLDTTLTKEKFPKWKQVFAAMLIKKACETGGLVKDIDLVMEASNKYRASQDYLTAFMTEKVIKQKNGVIEKNEINQEFNMWWTANYGQQTRPLAKDVHAYIDKIYGTCRDGIWKGIKIKYNSNIANVFDNDDVEEINSSEL
jgi:P4 family phage/plasmid primase-like protien